MMRATIRKIDGQLNGTINGTINGALNGTINGREGINGQLNDSQKETLEFVRLHEGFNTIKIAEGLNKPFRTIDKHIHVLVEMNLIVRRGSKKTGGYYIVCGSTIK